LGREERTKGQSPGLSSFTRLPRTDPSLELKSAQPVCRFFRMHHGKNPGADPGRTVIATRRLLGAIAIAAPFVLAAPALAAPPPNFVVAWAASAQGPYPIGNATAQPDLGFAFPDAKKGASDQSFRMIVRPDIWGRQARIRLSNAFGTRRVTFDAVFVGLQAASSAIVPGTNRPVTFGGNASVTLPIGGSAVSDPVTLPFVLNPTDRLLHDRRLAVSFHVVGDSGPITWHAKGLTTSYIGPPHAAASTEDEAEESFPFSTTSWYFLDAVDMIATGGTRAVVAFGDSITDGTGSTINGFDRWPDVLSRRLHALYGGRFSVVNAGIGGNMILGPADYLHNPFPGGPAATERVDRDVASLSGVGTVIWLEGINDFGAANAEPAALAGAVREHVGPAVVAVHGRRRAVGDRIAERDHDLGVRR